MVQGTGLESLCEIGEGAAELQQKIAELFDQEFDIHEVEQRRNLLKRDYSNSENTARLIGIIFYG
nr:hypothetical protein [Bacteroidota bacterium]